MALLLASVGHPHLRNRRPEQPTPPADTPCDSGIDGPSNAGARSQRSALIATDTALDKIGLADQAEWPLALFAALALGGCAGLPAGVDRDLTNGWPPMPEPRVPVPQSGWCYAVVPSETETWFGDFSPVPCAGTHQSETVFVGTFVGAPADRSTPPAWGSQGRIDAFTERRKKASDYLGGDFLLGRLGMKLVQPDSAAWTGGARWFRCDITRYKDLDDAQLNDNAGSVRDGLRGARPLAVTCAIESDDGKTNTVTDVHTTDCATPHNAELAGVFTAPNLPWEADDKARQNMASKGCEDVVASYLGLPDGEVTNPVLGWSFGVFTQNEWQRGDRTVRCFAVGFKGASSNGVRFTGSVKNIGNRAPT